MSSAAGLLTLRLTLAASLFLQAFFYPLASDAIRWVTLALPVLYAALGCLLYRGSSSGIISNRQTTAFFIADLTACLAVVLLTEGRGNQLYTVLLLFIVSACLLQRATLILSVSAAATVVYGLLVFPPPPLSAENMHVFYQRLTLFMLITLFSVHIADYAGQIERETARRFEERLAWMQRLSMVGKGMAAVLHEAKTPLATIVLNSETALHAIKEGGRPEEELRLIGQEAEHAAAILQNFLDFVKPTQLTLARIDLREPLQQAAAMARVRLEEQGITLDLKTLDACMVEGSARHLVQAFSNLFNNAADAMRSGGKLSVWMERQGHRALVYFVDTGVGMSRETLAAMFEPFTSSKANEEGHGLGLSIVRWILQEHGGDVAVESEGTGLGARVRVILPMVQ